jgi:hypothetical protein
VIGVGDGCPPDAPDEPLHRVWLDWEPPGTVTVDHYVVYRVRGETAGPGDQGEATDVPGDETFLLDTTELPDDEKFTYIVEAVLADGTVTPRSNTRTITAVNNEPVANAQAVEVWEDWLSYTITLTGDDVDSADLAFNVGLTSAEGGTVSGTPPNVKYKSASNYNGPDSFTFTVKETLTWNDPVDDPDEDFNQESEPATVSLTVNPVNDKPSFTKGANQTVTLPAGTQTVVGWATGFDAGPPDEDETQSLLQYIVTNNNNGLFTAGGQPAIATNGTLTYTPSGASGSATVTVRVQDNGGTYEQHGAKDTSDPQVFTITVNGGVAATQIKFFRTDVWMSTSSANRKFDLKAEVLKNGEPVPGLYKILTNQVLGSGSTFNKAIYKQIGSFPTTLVNFAASDTLSVRVSIKVSNSSPGGSNASGDIRLWYNIPTPPGNNSHLHAKRNGIDVKYYMITPFKLQKNGSVAGPTENVHEVVYKTGFTPLGIWSIEGP